MKFCNKCKTLKPYDEFNTYLNKNKLKRYCRSICKKCNSIYVKKVRDLKSDAEKEEDRIKTRTYHEKNKLLRAKNRKEKYMMHPEKFRDYTYKRNYKISLEEYNILFEKQLGLCAICHRPERAKMNKSKNIKRLAVDHDHKTGKVRGLLCGSCNHALGMFNDDENTIISALTYLRNNK